MFVTWIIKKIFAILHVQPNLFNLEKEEYFGRNFHNEDPLAQLFQSVERNIISYTAVEMSA